MELTDTIDIINITIFVVAIFAIMFFAFRWINLWYWKINDSIKNQEEQIRLLKKIAGESG